jgi:hypothetical protein
LLHANTTMTLRLSKHTRFGLGSRGSDITAAGAPLDAIVAHALKSYQDTETHSSNDAIRNACNLLSSSKGFQQSVLACEGAVAVYFSPATTEAAAGFAGGHLHHSAGGLIVACLCTCHLVHLSVITSQAKML